MAARFDRVRKAAQQGQRCGHRGATIGWIETGLKAAAEAANLDFGGFRQVRMDLASEVFNRTVSSYNELSDGELIALSLWVHGSIGEEREAEEWLKKTYGTQLELIPSSPQSKTGTSS